MSSSAHDRSWTPVGRVYRGIWCIGLLLILFAVMAVPSEAQRAQSGQAKRISPSTPDASDPQALAPFHRRLAEMERGLQAAHSKSSRRSPRADGQRREVAILQIGDSHTASDQFTGRLRTLFSDRFGLAGRGFLPPGAPHAWYRPGLVTVSQTAGWKTLTSNKSPADGALFGLSGVVARASDASDVIVIEPHAKAAPRSIEISLMKQPGGGTLEVLANGLPLATLPTRADVASIETISLGLEPGTTRIELRPFGDGPVELADHALRQPGPGIVLSNVGFIGAQVAIMGRWDWARAASQIAAMDPALIILAFGTNEGHAPAARIEQSYAAEFEARLVALKRAAPEASLVVIGPPDANRYPRFCLPKPAPVSAPPPAPVAADVTPAAAEPPAATNSGGSTTANHKSAAAAKPPPPEPPTDAVCEPLSADERASYDRLMAAEDRRLCRWHTPASIPIVRRIQRETAARHGALFFDWFELFEGECGADRWFRLGLAHKDRVHFKQDGYWRAADRLHARLMAGYVSPKR